MRFVRFLRPFILKISSFQLSTDGISTIKKKSRTDITGPFQSWRKAVQASTGYDSDLILEKTKNALLKVKNREAVYERDSVLFNKIQYSWPLLAGLMWAAAQSEGRLNVLDFGGSLGSTYYQNKIFIDALPEVRWNIIEQPKHVSVGRELFENDKLKFFSTIEEYSIENEPNVVVMSGILQYLESPYELIERLLVLSSTCAIIDLTPFWDGDNDITCVQTVPPCIYEASYPLWIFSKQKFINYLNSLNYHILAEFETLKAPPSDICLYYQGLIIVRKGTEALDGIYE